jgi:hypothetical protein
VLSAGGSAIVGAAILAVACFSFASEYSLGTLRNLLVPQPRRLTLFAGKLAATLLVLASAVIVGVLIASIAGVVVADARSSSTSAWFGASGVSALLKATAELAGASLGWATLGAALGVTLRSPTIVDRQRPLAEMSERELTLLRRTRIGFVFQQFNLIPTLTACQNIEATLAVAEKRPPTEDRRIAA